MRGVSKISRIKPTLEKVTEDKGWHLNVYMCGKSSEEGEIMTSPSVWVWGVWLKHVSENSMWTYVIKQLEE